MRSWVVFLNDDEAFEKKVKQFADKNNIKHAVLAVAGRQGPPPPGGRHALPSPLAADRGRPGARPPGLGSGRHVVDLADGRGPPAPAGHLLFPGRLPARRLARAAAVEPAAQGFPGTAPAQL